MIRRDFLRFAGATAMAWKPAVADAEIPRIGFIQSGSRQEKLTLLEAFGENLSALVSMGAGDRSEIDRSEDQDRGPRSIGCCAEVCAQSHSDKKIYQSVSLGLHFATAAERVCGHYPSEAWA